MKKLYKIRTGWNILVRIKSMHVKLPDINLLIKNILPIKASFVGDYIHPALGQTATQSIEQWRLNYLQELRLNNSLSAFDKFKVFITSLLLRANRGEAGGRLYDGLNSIVKNYEDLNEANTKKVLKEAGYRFPNQGVLTILNARKLLFDKYQGRWDEYFKKAKESYKSNFLADDFLKINGVRFKVRDLALSCFLKEYSANDFHVVDVLVRTGLILHGYGDINFGTNPNDEENYLFLRRLIIKISEQTLYSPGEIDRIFWHFGRAICKSKPLCHDCAIKNLCLTYTSNTEQYRIISPLNDLRSKTIHQKIADTVLNECQEGDKITRSEIIGLVKTRYPEIPFGSIVPSDVCSNMKNKDPQSGIHHIFFHLERGWYMVLPFETIRMEKLLGYEL